MRTFYRSHQIDVNTLPSGTIVFDVFQRGQQPHVLAGFSMTDTGEAVVAERMKSRVDQFINEAPAKAPTFIAARR